MQDAAHVFAFAACVCGCVYALIRALARTLTDVGGTDRCAVCDAARFSKSASCPTASTACSDGFSDDDSKMIATNSSLEPESSATMPLHRPRMMLLTVSQAPDEACELRADVSDRSQTSQIHGWLRSSSGELDGVYLQFQPEMLQADGGATLHELASRYAVGVWGYASKDPDNVQTLRALGALGVVYYNSDLPRSFLGAVAPSEIADAAVAVDGQRWSADGTRPSSWPMAKPSSDPMRCARMRPPVRGHVSAYGWLVL